MKIKIENRGVKVTTEYIYNTVSTSVILEATKQMCKVIDVFDGDEPAPQEVIEAVKKSEPTFIPEVTEAPQHPLIRPRIPNNVVDVKDLNIEQAVKEHALVRCPNCGQSHCIAINSGSKVYMMRKDYSTTDEEFNIIAEFDALNSIDFVNICKPENPENAHARAYFEDIQSMPTLPDQDFAVSNETEIFCPVCHSSFCFEEWKLAYEHPLNYFETEHLCDACGGEKIEKVTKGKKIYKCDACGLESPCKEVH